MNENSSTILADVCHGVALRRQRRAFEFAPADAGSGGDGGGSFQIKKLLYLLAAVFMLSTPCFAQTVTINWGTTYQRIDGFSASSLGLQVKSSGSYSSIFEPGSYCILIPTSVTVPDFSI
ncbi:MAG: hypothetical protein ABSG32_12285 [Terriglobia bacterium]|jgi:hypothetical protein